MAKIFGIEINIGSNADETAKDFEKVADSVEDIDSKVKNLKKSSAGSVTGFKKMTTSLKSLATAGGVILIITKAFEFFQETLGQNQKVLDFFNTTFEVLSIAFNDFFNFIFDNVGGIVESFKAFFEDPLKSIKDFASAIQEGIIDRFVQFQETLGFIGDAIGKLFSGDFAGAVKSLKTAGKEAVDVVTGVDGSFEIVKEKVNNAADAITGYVTETIKAGKANVDLAKSAEIAAAQNAKIIEQKDREAEIQRQIRDDETKTFEERKAASEQLAVVLDEQEKAMKANAAAIVAAAQAQFNKNKNDENQIALINAQTEAEGILAQVTGLRSEQQTSDVSLKKEIVDATNAVLESEANLSIEEKRINAEAIEDDLTRLKRQQEIDAEEKKLQTERLQRVVNEAKEGTQAKIDAQIALDEFEVEAEGIRLERKKEIAEKEAEIDKEAKEKEIENAKAVADAKKSIQDAQFANAEAGIALVKDLAGENNKLQALAIAAENAVGIAKIIISTQAANAAAKLKYAAIPGGLALAAAEITANKISAGIGIAASVAAAAKGIASLKASAPLDTGGDLGGGGAGSEPQAPSFNVVGDSGVNQLASLQTQPTQAFVVSGEVTTAQALDRNRVQNATL